MLIKYGLYFFVKESIEPMAFTQLSKKFICFAALNYIRWDDQGKENIEINKGEKLWSLEELVHLASLT